MKADKTVYRASQGGVLASIIVNALFGIVLFLIGVLNVLLVHPVPGVVFLFLSLIYFPPVNSFLKKRFGFSIPLVARIILGLIAVWFTLGVSDLGDMID